MLFTYALCVKEYPLSWQKSCLSIDSLKTPRIFLTIVIIVTVSPSVRAKISPVTWHMSQRTDLSLLKLKIASSRILTHAPYQKMFAVLSLTFPKLHVVYFSTGRNKRLQDLRVTEMLWDLCLS